MSVLEEIDVRKIEEYVIKGMQGSFPSEKGCDNETVLNLKLGRYIEVLDSDLLKNLFSKFLNAASNEELLNKSLRESLEAYLEENEMSAERQLEIMCAGVAALLLFMQANWTGPELDEDALPAWLLDCEAAAGTCLVLDGEALRPRVALPQLLVTATAVFESVSKKYGHTLATAPWWLLRCMMVHQRVLEEPSPKLHTGMMSLIEGVLAEASAGPFCSGEVGVLLPLECAMVHLHYSQVLRSRDLLTAALQRAGLSLQLVGALGKRTRYQEKEFSQLALKVELENEDNIPHESSDENAARYLPKDLQLEDDVRLERVQYAEGSEAGHYPRLHPIHQALTLAVYVQTQKSQPKDKLADEELMPYLECVLSAPQSWTVQMSALLLRCQLESWHSRSVQRAMNQCQVLVESLQAAEPPVSSRSPLLWATPLPPCWLVESELAGLLLSLGAVNSALDLFLRLEDWEAVVGCYHMLNLRHKAAEIVEQELRKKETVKLWCMLGDATDDPTHYEHAWELSARRSGRAQRHWGLYYFNRKQYDNAIPHLSQSLEINSLQLSLWSRLGYACLEQERWDECASAYRRYCALDTENFEAWNNLAKAYVKTGQKARAWKALKEAVKCNFDNWRVWDNLMVVSTDCSEYEEVIRAYHRILDLKARHVDEEVLRILVTAVSENMPDSAGVPAGRLGKAALGLFGRLTGQVTNNATLWRLYAQLTASREAQTAETLQRTAQYLQKSHRSAVQNLRWAGEPETAAAVLRLSVELADAYLQCFQKCTNHQAIQMLSSARLSLKGVISKVKQELTDLASGSLPAELGELVSTLEEKMRLIEDAMQSLQPQEAN